MHYKIQFERKNVFKKLMTIVELKLQVYKRFLFVIKANLPLIKISIIQNESN